jgi:hypothetical protein
MFLKNIISANTFKSTPNLQLTNVDSVAKLSNFCLACETTSAGSI